MLRFRSQSGKPADFREISFSYYPLLMKWALQLTRRDLADAEDLVHDLYVQTAQTSPRHDGIEDMEAYLFSVLRNLHYARLRRMNRSPIDELSILDFDSLQRGLASVDRRQLFDIRVTLGSVCEYVCERKNTSRSAAILILRFFLGYFPSEVMKIARMTRGAVDQSLQVARLESQLHLDRPGTLVPISQGSSSPSSFRGGTQDSLTLFASLRGMIFSSRAGACFPAGELARRYAGEAGFSTAELAHLVSCRACLDDANEILDLPPLDERSPDETLGRDNSQGPGGAGGPREVPRQKTARSSGSDAARRKIKQKMREVFEHRPRELQIAVDGDVRSSQKITSEVSDFYLRLDAAEKPGFIEILSEQKIRVAYLHVADPLRARRVEQQESVLLSDDRLLRVTLSHADDAPMVRVVYHDPVVAQVAAAAEVSRPQRALAGGSVAQGPASSSRLARWMRFGTAKVKGFLPDMNPTLATALILAVSSVLCFLLWLRQPPAITANALLNRAERWDLEAQRSGAPGVIYQKIQIQTPRRRLQRELYRDVRGKRLPRAESLSAQDEQLQRQMAAAGVWWEQPLSVNSYQAWHDHQHLRSDTITRPGDHLLRLTTTVPVGAVARASLTVRDTDFHPVERTLEMRDAGTIEIAELSYDVMPWSAAREEWFEPAAIEAPPGPMGRESQPGLAAVVPRLPRDLSEAELDEAELGARLALHDLGIDTSERMDVVAPVGIATGATASTALSIYPATANSSQPVTLTATLTPQFGETIAPAGTVTFANGGTTIGTGTVTNKVATLTTSSLPVGSYSITATYGGDTLYAAAASFPSPLSISSIPVPTVTVAASAASAKAGQNVTLTATVAAYIGSNKPTGTGTFLGGNGTIGTAALNGAGVATLSTAALPVGQKHNLLRVRRRQQLCREHVSGSLRRDPGERHADHCAWPDLHGRGSVWNARVIRRSGRQWLPAATLLGWSKFDYRHHHGSQWKYLSRGRVRCRGSGYPLGSGFYTGFHEQHDGRVRHRSPTCLRHRRRPQRAVLPA